MEYGSGWGWVEQGCWMTLPEQPDWDSREGVIASAQWQARVKGCLPSQEDLAAYPADLCQLYLQTFYRALGKSTAA